MIERKVYTEERYLMVNRANKSLLEDYLIELKSRRRSKGTLSQYLCDGRMILCYIYLKMDNRDVLEMNKKDFRRIALWLTEERKVSNARFNRIFALIRGMLEYAEDEDDYEYEKNIARKIKGLERNPVKEIFFLTDHQIHILRKYLIDHKMYKQCVYLDLSYDSAGRIGEITQIKKYDILQKRSTNTVIGKRGKPFKLIYHKNTVESLALYLDERGDDNIESLWVTGEGDYRRSITADALYCWCKQMTHILYDLDGKFIDFTPHSFRHSALENYKKGTHYMCKEMDREDGFTIEELQALAHHDSAETTQSYLKKMDDDILEKMFAIKIA